MCRPGQEVHIRSTFITNTRDLFILVFVTYEKVYKLYKIDLDRNNLREIKFDDKIDILQLYQLSDSILQYNLDAVQSKNFTQMHVRGSSHKENIDFNEELFVLLLHEDTIYIWQQDRNPTKSNPIQLLKTISSVRFQAINDSTIYFREDVMTEN